jgi:hypothetical protein
MNYRIPHTNYRITWASSIGTTILLALIIFCLLIPILLGVPFLVMAAPFIGMAVGSIVAAFVLNSQRKEDPNKAFMLSLAKILSVIVLTMMLGFVFFGATSLLAWGSHISDEILLSFILAEFYSIYFSLTAIMNVNNAGNSKKIISYKVLLLALALILIAAGLGYGLIMMAIAMESLFLVTLAAIIMLIVGIYRKPLIIPPYADNDFCAKAPDSYQ